MLLRGIVIVALLVQGVVIRNSNDPDNVAAMTPIDSWSVTSGGKPYGCDSWADGQESVWFTLARQAGLAPSGSDAIRVSLIRNNDLGDNGFGCRFNGESSAVTQGATRYVRFRIYYHAPMNWRSDNCGGSYCSNNRTAPDKLFILANTCGTPSRMILHQSADAPNRDTPRLRLTQGTGSTAPADWVYVSTNTWLHVQGEMRSSSAVSASDGWTKLWVNNNTFGSPDTQELDIEITTSGWSTAGCPSSQIVFGDGSMNPLSDDIAETAGVYDLADFVYDDEFDPAWCLSCGG